MAAAARAGAGRRRREADQFSSYYGKPIIKQPCGRSSTSPATCSLGGLAGATSMLARRAAELTRRPRLARRCKLVRRRARLGVSLVALVHDLGRPARFINMLRMFKPTSPMSVGVWLLGVYAPAAQRRGCSASCSGRELGRTAAPLTRRHGGAALLGAGVASYTAALIANTARPAWHEGHREMPFVFVGSAASAGAGSALLGSPIAQNAPARAPRGDRRDRRAARACRLLERRIGIVAENYARRHGRQADCARPRR